jgi:hypothetical protein
LLANFILKYYFCKNGWGAFGSFVFLAKNQKTKKPKYQKTKIPKNQNTKKPKYQKTKIPQPKKIRFFLYFYVIFITIFKI